MSHKKTVLVIGIDPQYLDFTSSEFSIMPGITAEKVTMGINNSITQLNEIGYEAHLCWIDLGATAIEVIKEHLNKINFDGVIIGAGIRKLDSNFILFERMINIILETAPKTKICFNTNPMDTAAAAQRWVKI